MKKLMVIGLVVGLVGGVCAAPKRVEVSETGKFSVMDLVEAVNDTVDLSTTNSAQLAETLQTGKDAVLGSVTVENLTVDGGGNVITTADVASGEDKANKLLKLDENGKIDAELVETIIIVFAGAEAVDVQ